MDKRHLVALTLGTALGAGGITGASALLARVPQAPIAVKTELVRHEQKDGGVLYYQRTYFKERTLDGGEKYGAQAAGVVVDPTQQAACEAFWKSVVTQPEKLVSAQQLTARDAGK